MATQRHHRLFGEFQADVAAIFAVLLSGFISPNTLVHKAAASARVLHFVAAGKTNFDSRRGCLLCVDRYEDD